MKSVFFKTFLLPGYRLSFRRVRSFSAGDLSTQESISKPPLSKIIISPLNIPTSSSEPQRPARLLAPGSLIHDEESGTAWPSIPSSRNRERSHSEGGDLDLRESNQLELAAVSLDAHSSKFASLGLQGHKREASSNTTSASPSIWTWAWGAFPVKAKSALEADKKLVPVSKDSLEEEVAIDSSTIFSFCGQFLSASTPKGSPEFSPQTSEELKRLLKKYRLGSKKSRKEILGHEGFFGRKDVLSNFSFSENWLLDMPRPIIENPNLVIVIDDFLLPGIVGYQILMIIYHGCSDEFEIKRPLSEEYIAQFLKEKCVIDSISLQFFPRWFGKRVSQWDPINNGRTSITSNLFLPSNSENKEVLLEMSASMSKLNLDDPLFDLETRRWSSFVDLSGHLNFNLVHENTESVSNFDNPITKDTPVITVEDIDPTAASQSFWDDIDESVEIELCPTDNDPLLTVSLETAINSKADPTMLEADVVSFSFSHEVLLAGEIGDEDVDTDREELVSLEDAELSLLSLDDISPEPARGDIYDSDTDSYHSLSLEEGESGIAGIKKYRYRKSLVPTQEHLLGLDLKDGENEIVFQLEVLSITHINALYQ